MGAVAEELGTECAHAQRIVEVDMLDVSSGGQQFIVAGKRRRYEQNQLDTILITKPLERIESGARFADEFVVRGKWAYGGVCQGVQGGSVGRISLIQDEIPDGRPAGIEHTPMGN